MSRLPLKYGKTGQHHPEEPRLKNKEQRDQLTRLLTEPESTPSSSTPGDCIDLHVLRDLGFQDLPFPGDAATTISPPSSSLSSPPLNQPKEDIGDSSTNNPEEEENLLVPGHAEQPPPIVAGITSQPPGSEEVLFLSSLEHNTPRESTPSRKRVAETLGDSSTTNPSCRGMARLFVTLYLFPISPGFVCLLCNHPNEY